MESNFPDLGFSLGSEKGSMGALATESWGLGEARIRGWYRVKPDVWSPSWVREPFPSWDLCLPASNKIGSLEERSEPVGHVVLWVQPHVPWAVVSVATMRRAKPPRRPEALGGPEAAAEGRRWGSHGEKTRRH